MTDMLAIIHRSLIWCAKACPADEEQDLGDTSFQLPLLNKHYSNERQEFVDEIDCTADMVAHLFLYTLSVCNTEDYDSTPKLNANGHQQSIHVFVSVSVPLTSLCQSVNTALANYNLTACNLRLSKLCRRSITLPPSFKEHAPVFR